MNVNEPVRRPRQMARLQGGWRLRALVSKPQLSRRLSSVHGTFGPLASACRHWSTMRRHDLQEYVNSACLGRARGLLSLYAAHTHEAIRLLRRHLWRRPAT